MKSFRTKENELQCKVLIACTSRNGWVHWENGFWTSWNLHLANATQVSIQHTSFAAHKMMTFSVSIRSFEHRSAPQGLWNVHDGKKIHQATDFTLKSILFVEFCSRWFCKCISWRSIFFFLRLNYHRKWADKLRIK